MKAFYFYYLNNGQERVAYGEADTVKDFTEICKVNITPFPDDFIVIEDQQDAMAKAWEEKV